MKFLVDTPKGTGVMIKAFNKHKIRFVRVAFTNKPNKKGGYATQDFIYSQCTVHRAPGPIMRWIYRLIKYFQ
jgi:hypothetical protein